jgi:hypothetical protein
VLKSFPAPSTVAQQRAHAERISKVDMKLDTHTSTLATEKNALKEAKKTADEKAAQAAATAAAAAKRALQNAPLSAEGIKELVTLRCAMHARFNDLVNQNENLWELLAVDNRALSVPVLPTPRRPPASLRPSSRCWSTTRPRPVARQHGHASRRPTGSASTSFCS